MIKRTTAFLFLSMAYLIIMAHAVVPHHHHNEWMSVQHPHCAAENQSHRNSTSEHDHEDDCRLVLLIVRPETQEEEITVPSSLFNCHTDYTLPDKVEGPVCSPACIESSDISQPSSSYLLYAAAALVKRAPPAA